MSIDTPFAAHSTSCIDVHCHVVPLDLPVDPTGGRQNAWPRMCCEGGHSATFVAGITRRRFDDRTWNASRRRDYMNKKGIAVQVLSPLPELLGYWFEPESTATLCRSVNDYLAQMIDVDRSRFAALGGLPMNDVDLAIAEARRLKSLGFDGVEIGSNVNGASPADVHYRELLSCCQELNLAVFVHGIRPATHGRLVGPAVLESIVGIPLDTALCVASFIGMRVLERFPALRVAFSHGGGGIGAIIDRVRHVWTVMPEFQEQLPGDPLLEARRYYYDMLTFSSEYTRFLIDKLGSSRLFVGTDFPAGGMGLMDPIAFLLDLNLSPIELSDITRGTALRFLGRDGQPHTDIKERLDA